MELAATTPLALLELLDLLGLSTQAAAVAVQVLSEVPVVPINTVALLVVLGVPAQEHLVYRAVLLLMAAVVGEEAPQEVL